MGILTLSANRVARLRRTRRRAWAMIGLSLLWQIADGALHTHSASDPADAALASVPHASQEILP